jgi:hypothetical protein
MARAAEEDRADTVAAWLRTPLLVAALLTILTTVLQLVHVGEPWRTIREVLDWAIWLGFLAGLVAMLAVVRDRARYIFDHPLEVGTVILTPPFFLAAMQSIRVLRLLRLLRLLRVPGSGERTVLHGGRPLRRHRCSLDGGWRRSGPPARRRACPASPSPPPATAAAKASCRRRWIRQLSHERSRPTLPPRDRG